ncbi:MDR family MFS transporter [Paenibacillus sp. y28]|uniref:MDR family MFS transporter n=1 Tax=Paenibacillus sp. y28 TaxID=3129110 RepID=UPI00301673A7
MQKKTSIKWTVAGLMLGLLLAALDQTIIATAMPTIVGEMGGMEQFIWVFSAYMIASVAAMPIFGKLSDMYGRKLFFLSGLIVFMLGSALCGTAETMLQLIIFRAIQGIGGGALLPITFTIIFDIFPPEKRAKTQGLFGAVFGLSSVLGPIAGAFFTDYLHWNWIFYINLPLGVIAFVLLYFFYFETLERKRQRIDWTGTLVLTAMILSLMFALEMGGKEYAWLSGPIIGLFALFAALFIVFLAVERRAADPVVPLALFRNPLFTASMVICFSYGALGISGASYIPMFVQGVFGGSATEAGTIMTPMMLCVTLSSAMGSMLLARMSYRGVLLISASLILVSVVLLGMLDVHSPRWAVTLYMMLLGAGIGINFPVISLTAQHKVEFRQRGSVNSMVTSFRTIGSAIGVTLFGSLQASQLQQLLSGVVQDPAVTERFKDPQTLLQPEVRTQIPQEMLQGMISALADSIGYIFQWSLVFVALSFVFILMMGKARMELNAAGKPGASKQVQGAAPESGGVHI